MAFCTLPIDLVIPPLNHKSNMNAPAIHTGPQMPDRLNVDVCIIGAGIVGQTLALALGRIGLRVLLVDNDETLLQKRRHADSRTYVLLNSSWAFLKGLGLADALGPKGFPIRRLQFECDAAQQSWAKSLLRFSDADTDGQSLGQVITHTDLSLALWRGIETCDSVHVRLGENIHDLERADGKVCARFKSGLTVDCALIAGCDGKHSATRQWVGGKRRLKDTKQWALPAFVRHETPNDGTACQFLSSRGSFSIAPLSPNLSSLTFFEPDVDGGGPQNDLDECLRSYTTPLTTRLGAFELQSEAGAFPLSTGVATRFVGPNVALLGEAAHSFHPMTGQGLNYGFRDVITLAGLLNHQCLDTPAQLDRALVRYDKTRRSDAALMERFSNTSLTMFSSHNILTALTRRLIFKSLNKLPSARRHLIQRANGNSVPGLKPANVVLS